MGTRGIAQVKAVTRPPAAKRSLGQHFLTDRRVVARILEAAELTPDDIVVEVGPGRGILTSALAERAGSVVAVEFDDALAERLAESLEGHGNVRVVPADARDVDIDSLVAPESPYKVVANLPYYAATPIIRRFLEAQHKPALMVVMVQREVAREMAARPGKMGLLSVATQLYGSPRIVASVPPRAFRPTPKVTSAVVRIDVYTRPALDLDSVQGFFQVVRAGFAAPRKQLHNSLSLGLELPPDEIEAMLSKAHIDPKRRAQTLGLQEWGTLYEVTRSSLHTASAPRSS